MKWKIYSERVLTQFNSKEEKMDDDILIDEYLDLKINDCIIGFRDRYRKEYDVIKEFNAFFRLLQIELGKKGQEKQNVCIMASLNQSHKLYQSAVLLFERGLVESANVLIRTILDLIFKITECIRNEEFVDKLLIDEKYELIKTLQDIKRNSMFDMLPLEKIEKYIEECNKEIKNHPRPNLKASILATKNGLEKAYILYRFQCDYTHQSASTIGRIIKQTEDGLYIDGDLQLEDFRQSIAWLMSITDIIFPIIIKEYLKSEELQKKHEELVVNIESTFKDLV